MTTTAEVMLWGTRIGALVLEDGDPWALFQYDPGFLRSGRQVSPIMMPLGEQAFRFPDLAVKSFHGLPGLVSDSLPDKYGTALIDAWLAGQGRAPGDFNALERLCYVGTRGMGALEFRPVQGPAVSGSGALDIAELVSLASDMLTRRGAITASFSDQGRADAVRHILQIGTSAGGARAKAIVAWNPDTNEVRSGQVAVGSGFQHWLIKFDGVQENKDKELADPKGYGAIEYAYFLMAQGAAVEMSPCRLLEEGGRRHFMTRRFDRDADGGKVHMQSLGALAHFDFNEPALYSYEQAFLVMRQLGLTQAEVEQQFRRTAFNVIARNQDDHVKNIAYMMGRDGRWRLSPAYDVTYSFNPTGDWTACHQMSINGKRDGFTADDLIGCAEVGGVKARKAKDIVREVDAAASRWPDFAGQAGVQDDFVSEIGKSLRLGLLGS